MLDLLKKINKLDIIKEIKLTLSKNNIPPNFAKHFIDTCNIVRSIEGFQSASKLIKEYSSFTWEDSFIEIQVSEMNNLIDMSHFEDTYPGWPAVEMFKTLVQRLNLDNLTSEEDYIKTILNIDIDLMIHNLHSFTPIIFIKRYKKLELIDGMHRITAKILKRYYDTGIDFSNLSVSIPAFLGTKIEA